MADAGAILKIGADNSEYNRVVNGMPKTMEKAVGQVEQSAQKASGAIGNLMRAFDGAMLAAGMSSILTKFDDIADAAKRLGMSAEDVQRIGESAKMSGSNLESVDRVVRAITISANKAAAEGGDAAEKFSRIGIDPEKFISASLTEKIKMLSDAQERAAGSASKMADFYEAIGGRAGAIDFSALIEGMDGVSVASNKMVEDLGRANDQLDQLKNRATIAGASVLNFLGTTLPTRVVEAFMGLSPGETEADANGRILTEGEQQRLDKLDMEAKKKRQFEENMERERRAAEKRTAEMEKAAKEAEKKRQEELKDAENVRKSHEEAAKRADAYNAANYKWAGQTRPKLEQEILNMAASRGVGNDIDQTAPDMLARGTTADLMRGRARISRMQQRMAEYESRGAFGAAAGMVDRMQMQGDEMRAHQLDRLNRRIEGVKESMKQSGVSAGEMEYRSLRLNRMQEAIEKLKSGSDNKQGVEDDVSDILKEIQKRLPITALG